MKVAVVGLGKAGLPLAAVIAESGLEVVGVDLDEEKCKMINSGINPIPEEPGLDELIKKHGGKKLKATPNYEEAKDCKAYIVIVPLLLDENKNPDFSVLESAFRSIGKILKKGDLVVLETTVPPFTTENLVKRWLEDESGLELGDFYLAFSPERIMTGYSISRLREFPKVIGGVDEESGRKAYELYKKFVPNLHLVSNARTAEFIKIIEGCYRDANIALANELFKIAEEIGADFFESREKANHEFCHIHLPSTGVGGHCIPVYTWFLINEMEKGEKFEYVRLLRTAREINDEMINYWAEKIVMECMRVSKPLSEVKICIKGITFRKGVKEIYHSKNLALAKLLAEKGLDLGVWDELFTPEEVEKLGLKWREPEEADVVFDCFELKLFSEMNKEK
ncbi:nucleotide sugar dehydrogenase [Ferroglobus placidus DSM 10642]|uniref:UDP-N-acetyl-D-mannosamine dehydrogenase n=1 Tax=Ferroglobus placidus (strain DSM 10642 / AEDII12DO) TaxID=589924 RepID=D3S1N1_FERPA|nr:nucleotide sugar dehydrogenase [Ferroglobus placidus]ADC66495.1 nucleotide sugar dehydrogenase [Ferroglobus placidus DSM 10642]